MRVFMKSVGASARTLAGVRARLRCLGSNGVSYENISAPITVQTAATAPADGTPPNLAETSADIPVPENCTTAQTGIPLEVGILRHIFRPSSYSEC
jgi:hypothetical protein